MPDRIEPNGPPKKRAYLIFECNEGWCMATATHPELRSNPVVPDWAAGKLGSLLAVLRRIVKGQ